MKKFMLLKRDDVLHPFIALAVVAIFISWPAIHPVLANDGDLDPTFGNGGIVVTDFGRAEDVSTVLIQEDGKIIAIGSAISGESFTLARYNTDGSLDSTFGTGGKVQTSFYNSTQAANSAVLQPDGKIIVGGTAFKTDHYVFALARYNVDGSPDPSFGTGGIVDTDLFEDEQASAIWLRQDGKIVAAGNSFSNGLVGLALARYNPDGSLDSSFGEGGKVLVNVIISGIGGLRLASAFQPDNKIIMGGASASSINTGADFTLVRLNEDGSLDSGFGVNGKVTTDFANSNDFVFSMALQPDGKIVAVGRTDTASPVSTHSGLVRYNSDGSLDASFGTGGKVTNPLHHFFDEARAVLIQKDGKIVMGGQTAEGLLIARYNINGSLDEAFGANGYFITRVGLAPIVKSLAAQDDGGIIAGGLTLNHGSDLDFVLVRVQGASFDLCLQDDSTNNLLQINSATGVYQFTNCFRFNLGGTGRLTKKGNTITLQHNASDRRVSARIDTSSNRATASIQLLSQGRTFTITDRNTANNTCGCQ